MIKRSALGAKRGDVGLWAAADGLVGAKGGSWAGGLGGLSARDHQGLSQARLGTATPRVDNVMLEPMDQVP